MACAAVAAAITDKPRRLFLSLPLALCRNTPAYCFFVASACPRSTISTSISLIACINQHNTQRDKL